MPRGPMDAPAAVKKLKELGVRVYNTEFLEGTGEDSADDSGGLGWECLAGYDRVKQDVERSRSGE